jgi:branched-subunit amino acid transport protein
MGAMDKLMIFAGMAAVTYLTRYAMIAMLGRELPAPVHRWLRYVPVAVLTALITPAALAPADRLALDQRTWAVAAGAVVAWRTRSVWMTMVSGMVTFWVLQAVWP